MTITVDGIPVSGSTGAETFSRNRYGAYTRRRVKPVNPNSAAQVFARNSFRSAVTRWTDILTSIERSSWETWAANTPMLNKAGQTIHLTGQAAYIRACSFWFYNAGAECPNTAPGLFSTGAFSPSLNSVTYDTSADTLVISISANPPDNAFQVEDGILECLVSAPANPSVNFPPSRFSLAATTFIGAVPASPVVSAATPSPFVFQTGQRVWVKARASTPDGLVSSQVLLGPITVTVVA